MNKSNKLRYDNSFNEELIGETFEKLIDVHGNLMFGLISRDLEDLR